MDDDGRTKSEKTIESETGTTNNAEQELATKMLNIQPKRFYLDVKQNRRGRFIKITEVSAGGRKSRLLMSMGAASDFKNHLVSFAEFCETAEKTHTADEKETQIAANSDGARLKSEVMVKDTRRYYIDLKENSRGKFLRVTQTMARGGGGPRAQIAIPAEGIKQVYDALGELLTEYGKEEDIAEFVTTQLPEGKQIRVSNKMFYFDVGQNNRGVFMKISEVHVSTGFRQSITIPEKSWPTFRDYFVEVCDKVEHNASSITGSLDHDSSSEPKVQSLEPATGLV